MNFWGLTPAVFPLIERQLVEFLEGQAPLIRRRSATFP